MIRKAIVFSACLLLNLALTSTAKAEQISIEVTGNGNNSSNEVSTQSQSQANVSQQNDANVTNNVSTDANTGENETSFNTNGETSVNTGDATTTTNVSNENINTNSAEVNTCCDQGSLIKVSGNGDNSTNIVGLGLANTASSSQKNSANVANNVSVNANTGYNKALFNGGSSMIVTGNIKANTNVSNKNINNSIGSIESFSASAVIKVEGNGVGSENLVYLTLDNEVSSEVLNIVNIVNNIEQFLNTGGNETLKNLGDVMIFTGDIESNINILNENINSSVVNIECNCYTNEDPKTPPTTPTSPSNPSSGSSIVQGSSGSSGSSSNGGPASGSTLPKTGNSIPLTFVATLILFFLLLSGLYLRSNAANAPPVA